MEVDNHLRRLIRELSWVVFSEENFNAKFSHDLAKEKMAEINKFLREPEVPASAGERGRDGIRCFI